MFLLEMILWSYPYLVYFIMFTLSVIDNLIVIIILEKHNLEDVGFMLKKTIITSHRGVRYHMKRATKSM